MDYSEKWGVSIENAVELALADLRLTRDQVEVTVLEEPSKGFFGIGSKLAKVRVSKREKPKETEKVRETPKVSREFKEEKPEIKEIKKEIKEEKETKESWLKKTPKRGEEPEKTYIPKERPVRERVSMEGLQHERPDNLVSVTEDNKVLQFLKDITENMGLEVSVKGMENEDMVFLDIEGADSGTIIGKRGQTLDAIQYLTSLVANKGDGKYIKVVVDAENYRQKREKTLEQLANRLAQKVKKSRKSVRLEPMNPYERKVIHSTLQNDPEVVTRSEGQEPYRRVIIDLK